MSNVIDSFSGDYRFLSNFFIEPDGSCVEKEFQAAKTPDLGKKVKILMASSPGHAKKLGRSPSKGGIVDYIFPEWDEWYALETMQSLVLRKFLDHEILSIALIETGDAELIEGNNWGDNRWGCVKVNGQWEGKNLLGNTLINIRDLINSYG